VIEELSRFFAPAYVREEVERLRGWQQQLQLDTSFGRVMNSPTWISGVSIQNKTVDAEKLNVKQLQAITAKTGSLTVTGVNAAGQDDPSLGQILVAANPNQPNQNSITIRATAATGQIAGIRLRNASGAATTEFRLDGSAQIGAGATAVTVDQNGVVSIPAGALAGGLVITNVGGGRIGGIYELYQSAGSTRIVLDRDQGIAAFGAGDPATNWNTSRFWLRLDGSAKFTGGIQIDSTTGQLQWLMDTTNGFRLRNTSQGVDLFAVDTTGTLRIRRGVIGSSGSPGSGARVEIDDTGVKGFGTSGATFALRTDGSGFIKAGASSTDAIVWNNTGVTINASTITVNDLYVNQVKGGVIGGTYEVPTTQSIVWQKHSSGVPVSFVTGGALRVESPLNQILIRNSVRDGAGNQTQMAGLLFSAGWDSTPPNNPRAWIQLVSGTSDSSYSGVALIYMRGLSFGTSDIYLQATYLSAAVSELVIHGTSSGTFLSANNMPFTIRTGTTARITMNATGTSIHNASGTERIRAADRTYIYGAIQNDQVAESGISGTLPAARKALAFYNGAGQLRYIPVYTAINPWAI
jgi:hypothetical protein